jgi:hypothetical protein
MKFAIEKWQENASSNTDDAMIHQKSHLSPQQVAFILL